MQLDENNKLVKELGSESFSPLMKLNEKNIALDSKQINIKVNPHGKQELQQSPSMKSTVRRSVYIKSRESKANAIKGQIGRGIQMNSSVD
mmetsp:Transcript_29833/g.28993  ORF Transcript_29833/g.28993 Transcript_29833/m.28993 type:complete len:90 (-) Transcript_29833:233-502(-)